MTDDSLIQESKPASQLDALYNDNFEEEEDEKE